jgi:hypothetical protein
MIVVQEKDGEAYRSGQFDTSGSLSGSFGIYSRTSQSLSLDIITLI